MDVILYFQEKIRPILPAFRMTLMSHSIEFVPLRPPLTMDGNWEKECESTGSSQCSKCKSHRFMSMFSLIEVTGQPFTIHHRHNVSGCEWLVLWKSHLIVAQSSVGFHQAQETHRNTVCCSGASFTCQGGQAGGKGGANLLLSQITGLQQLSAELLRMIGERCAWTSFIEGNAKFMTTTKVLEASLFLHPHCGCQSSTQEMRHKHNH